MLWTVHWETTDGQSKVLISVANNEVDELCVRKPSSAAEMKRKQTTAVVLLGVIGAEFGQDVGETSRKRSEDQRRKSSVVEGFGIGNNNLARLT
ncbi:WD repeat-containing protein 7-like, partial [Homalodisca vitripennis]|uniref:WD repeat-containing protein 7-like n=1 Tax=Homalodisca vitripennis TaxID=197043 RepID=UPI001EEC68DB